MSTFKKFGKGVNDGLKLKYNFNRQLKIRTNTANGIQITTTGISGKDGDFSGSVHGQVKVADVGTVKAELFTSGATEVTVEADKVAKGFVFRATGTDAPKLTADIEYTQDVFAGTLNFDVSKSTTVIGASGVVGFDGFAVGGEAKFDTKASELSDFNAGFEYTNGDFTGTIKTREKADNIDVSTFHKVNPDWTSGALCSYNFLSRNWKLTGLTSYILSDTTNIKAKADSTGMVATCLEQRVTGNNVLVRLSTEFNAKKHTTVPEKVGLSVFFGEGFTEKD